MRHFTKRQEHLQHVKMFKSIKRGVTVYKNCMSRPRKLPTSVTCHFQSPNTISNNFFFFWQRFFFFKQTNACRSLTLSSTSGMPLAIQRVQKCSPPHVEPRGLRETIALKKELVAMWHWNWVNFGLFCNFLVVRHVYDFYVLFSKFIVDITTRSI